ncbi:unnamed protein product, partial [Rotaria magnacalcarata]
TNMSAGILPDIYRYTARKSTVSKTSKSSNVSMCNNSNPPITTATTTTTTTTTHYSAYHNDNNSKQPPLFDTIEHTIKLEEEIPQPLESFIILPDNEIEQMIIGENNNEQTDEEIIHNIIEQIKNQIVQSSSTTIASSSNKITENFSIDTQDVHEAIGSIMNRMNKNDHEESLSSTVDNKIEENVNRNLEDETTPMESDQPTTDLPQSRIDDDIVELEVSYIKANQLLFLY